MNLRTLLSLMCVASLCISAGCFKSSTTQGSSESSSNSSKSSSNSSKSSSNSSSPSDDAESSYARDVRDLTATYAANDLDVRSFQRTLSSIARDYGVTDWEQHQRTYIAIGQGLARAGVNGVDAAQFSQNVAAANPQRTAWIRSGYEGVPGTAPE
jgi:hypothetical protein